MRVLIIEDEPAYVDALTVALEREGYEPFAATDGRSAVTAFLEGSPEIVLLDLMLPEMSGLDVLRRITPVALGLEVSQVELLLRSR